MRATCAGEAGKARPVLPPVLTLECCPSSEQRASAANSEQRAPTGRVCRSDYRARPSSGASGTHRAVSAAWVTNTGSGEPRRRQSPSSPSTILSPATSPRATRVRGRSLPAFRRGVATVAADALRNRIARLPPVTGPTTAAGKTEGYGLTASAYAPVATRLRYTRGAGRSARG
jgi:hypothetical protein